MTKLPNKIFNRCTNIPFNQLIYVSRNGGEFHFGGVRNRRKGKECVFYIVPNNTKNKFPNIKGIEKEELEKLWSLLKQNEIITTADFRMYFPELYNEGSCCFTGFWGIINFLFPNTFTKTHGAINLIKF